MRAGLPLAAIAALTLAACDKPKEAAPQADAAAQMTGKLSRDAAGREAPATPFLDPRDGPVTLAGFRGKPLLVNLWATWCAPCIHEMPSLDALGVREAAKPDGVQVVVVSEDIAGRRVVDPFFAKMRFKALQPYLDKEMLLGEGVGGTNLPITILYDAAGKEVWRVEGAKDWAAPDVAELLAEAKTDG